MTSHSCNKEKQWNCPIIFAISIKEPLAVYPFLLPSTVSQFVYDILGDVLIKLSPFPDADVCGFTGHQYFTDKHPESRRSVI